MRWKWPNSKLDILENLKEVVQRTNKGKLTSLEFSSSRSAIILLRSAIFLLRSATVCNSLLVNFGGQNSCWSAGV